MDFTGKVNEFLNTRDCTGEFSEEDREKNRGLAVLSYVPPFLVIPLLMAKESEYVRFHSNQGLVLTVIEVVLCIVFGAMSGIPYVGVVFGIMKALVTAGCLVLWLFGVVNAAGGKAKELPLIGGIRLFAVHGKVQEQDGKM